MEHMLTLELLNIFYVIRDGLFLVEQNLSRMMVATSVDFGSKLTYVASLALKHFEFLFQPAAMLGILLLLPSQFFIVELDYSNLFFSCCIFYIMKKKIFNKILR